MGSSGFNLTTEDIDVIYQLYPRKVGKATGYARIRRHIKSNEKYLDLLEATANYCDYLKMNGITLQYTMMFSTFVNNRWLDFVKREDCGLTKPVREPSFVKVK